MKRQILNAAIGAVCIAASAWTASAIAQDASARQAPSCCMQGEGMTGQQHGNAMPEGMREHGKEMMGPEHDKAMQKHMKSMGRATGRGPGDPGRGAGRGEGGPERHRMHEAAPADTR